MDHASDFSGLDLKKKKFELFFFFNTTLILQMQTVVSFERQRCD